MKKLTTVLTILSSLLIAVTAPVFAQGNQGVTQEARQERSKHRFDEVTTRIIDKVTVRFQRYESFISKLESRRRKLSDEGKDVTQLDNAIRLAKVELGSTRGVINTSKDDLAAIDFSQSPKVVREAIMVEIRDIRQAFQKLHQTVMNAVKIAGQINQAN